MSNGIGLGCVSELLLCSWVLFFFPGLGVGFRLIAYKVLDNRTACFINSSVLMSKIQRSERFIYASGY